MEDNAASLRSFFYRYSLFQNQGNPSAGFQLNSKCNFESPLSENPLYIDRFDKIHSDDSISHESPEIEVKRVLSVGYDPVTGKELSDVKIPRNVIKSRLGHSVYGDALVVKPTDVELMTRINLFLDDLTKIITQSGLSEENFIVQTKKALHFSFGSVMPPCTKEVFFSEKSRDACNPQPWEILIRLLQKLLDATQLRMIFNEIKLNPDGHIVLRMTITPKSEFLAFRRDFQMIFPSAYSRYTDPEKMTTLAAVLGVIDLSVLQSTQKKQFLNRINLLFEQFTESVTKNKCSTEFLPIRSEKFKTFNFDAIEIIEHCNRMLQLKSTLGKVVLKRGKGVVPLVYNPFHDRTKIDPSYCDYGPWKMLSFRGFFRLKDLKTVNTQKNSSQKCATQTSTEPSVLKTIGSPGEW